MFGRATAYSTVVHSDLVDVVSRSMHYFNIMNIKPTFVMLLHFVHSNISIHSFFCNILMFVQVIMRSRTKDNMYVNDTLLYMKFDEVEYVSEIHDEVHDEDEDDDEEYKASQLALDASYFELEQQLSLAGFILHNSLYSFQSVNTFISFGYLN